MTASTVANHLERTDPRFGGGFPFARCSRYAWRMEVPAKTLKLLRARDDHCWHCGMEEDLVPHHRKNRGMGGSKLLDTPDNLMMVCGQYNGAMESSAAVASSARGWGHKLAVWEELGRGVFDCTGFSWWILLADGTKVKLDRHDLL